MHAGSVVMISGPAGAGKSSVARQLALGSPRERTVHLHTDDFYGAIVKGFIEPFRPEAHEGQKIKRFDGSPRRSARNAVPDPLAAARTPNFPPSALLPFL